MDGIHAQRAWRGDVRVGGDRAVGAVHVQYLHGVSGDRRGARGDDRVRRHPAVERRPLRHRTLDRRRPGHRVAAVAEHEIRADVGSAAARRGFPSLEKGTCHIFSEFENLGGRRDLCDLTRRLVCIFLCDLGDAVANGAVRIAGSDHPAQFAVRRARVVIRPGVRTRRVRAGLHPGCHGPLSAVARRRRLAPAGPRDHLHICRAAADGRRIRHLVGRHVRTGPADRLGPAVVDAADRRRISIRAGRIAAASRASPAVVDRRRHRDHARDRTGRPADQQRARRHVGTARFLVAAVGVVVAGAKLHRPALDDRVASRDLVAGDRRRCGGAAVEDARLARQAYLRSPRSSPSAPR